MSEQIKLTQADRARRWRTAIHEAGHVVAANRVGHKLIRAGLFDNGGGVCTSEPPKYRSHDGLGLAIIAAAGEQAADFTAMLPMPRGSMRSIRAAIETPPAAAAADSTVNQVALDNRDAAADWTVIRDWAARDDEYDEWAKRVNRVKWEAWQIIVGQTHMLARIARALFRRGVLGESEIAKLLSSRTKRKTQHAE